MPDGNIKVLVEGTERAKIVQVTSDEGFFRASIRVVTAGWSPTRTSEQASSRVTALFEQYVKLSQSLNYDTMIAAVRVEDADNFQTPSPRICRFRWKKNRNCSNFSIRWSA